MLYTASFYDPQHWMGLRYRVSRAHPRGLRVQWETATYLYPARELLRTHREGGLDFAEFTAEYRLSLDSAFDQLEQFREWTNVLPSLGDVTLLCFERGEQPCHRRLAAGWLLERVPGLGRGELR